MWTSVEDLIAKHQRFLLTTHLNPDHDAIGSEVALRAILRDSGKDAAIWNASPTPENCRFLDPAGEIHSGPGGNAKLLAWADAVVILDVNTWAHLGDVGVAIRGSDLPRGLIDHHRGGDPDIASARVSDVTAAATGVLIHELAARLGKPVAPEIATALYAALIVDTGSFRYSNADPRAFGVAAALVAAGAKPEPIFRAVFEERSWARYRLLPLAMKSLRSESDGRIAYMTLSQAMYREAGASEEDSDRFIEEIRGIRGVRACAVFRETETGAVKASLRANGDVDVHRVAARFGGGGHRAAAGVTVPGPLDDAVRKLVIALRESLTEGVDATNGAGTPGRG